MHGAINTKIKEIKPVKSKIVSNEEEIDPKTKGIIIDMKSAVYRIKYFFLLAITSSENIEQILPVTVCATIGNELVRFTNGKKTIKYRIIYAYH